MKRRTRTIVLALAAIVAVAAAVPFVAFVVIPIVSASRLDEDFPAAGPPSLPMPAASGAAVPGATFTAAPARTLARGELRRIDPAHYGTGAVLIVELGATRYLRFDDVFINAAPEMYVYLSESTNGEPGRYVDLGRLKATQGAFNYELPADLDLAKVRSVVIWCRPFAVTVTYAVMEGR